VTLYLFAGSDEWSLTTFFTRFAHEVSTG